MRRQRSIVLTLLALVGCASESGCNFVLDTSKFHTLANADDSGMGEMPRSQATSEGDGGEAAAQSCNPGTDRYSLENACTKAVCVPYTSSVPTCDGGRCPLPPSGKTGGGAGGGAGRGMSGDAGVGSGASQPCNQVQPDPMNIIYVNGSAALRGFIQDVSRILATQPNGPTTVVFQATGSCVGVKSVIDPGHNLMLPSAGQTTYFDASGNQQSCVLDNSGVLADIGASEIFFSTCYAGQSITPTLPGDVVDNIGPVQVSNFAVPQNSTQQSISLLAAYYVFGFGGDTFPIPPWTDPTQLQIRSAASGSQSVIAATIGVPIEQWKGVQNAQNGAVGNALIAAGESSDQTRVDSALGILTSDYLVQNVQSLRGLAIQDENAGCGYYPSSTATSHDFVSVRDGHYPLWGHSHLYARVNAQTQVPLKPGVTDFVDAVTGVTPLPGLDLIAEYATKGLIPLCAMHVSRSSDGANYVPYKPATSCNCYFDLMATGNTGCLPCNTDADCPSSSPSCNKFGPPPQQGYCDL